MEINGLEMIEVLALIKKRQNRYLALLLDDVEGIMEEDSKEFELVRKFILDYFNDYTRSIHSVLLGDDIEKLTFR